MSMDKQAERKRLKEERAVRLGKLRKRAFATIPYVSASSAGILFVVFLGIFVYCATHGETDGAFRPCLYAESYLTIAFLLLICLITSSIQIDAQRFEKKKIWREMIRAAFKEGRIFNDRMEAFRHFAGAFQTVMLNIDEKMKRAMMDPDFLAKNPDYARRSVEVVAMKIVKLIGQKDSLRDELGLSAEESFDARSAKSKVLYQAAKYLKELNYGLSLLSSGAFDRETFLNCTNVIFFVDMCLPFYQAVKYLTDEEKRRFCVDENHEIEISLQKKILHDSMVMKGDK